MRSAKFVHRRVENVLNLVSNWKSYIEKCLQKIFFLMFFLTPTLLLAHEGHFKKSITQNIENHHISPEKQENSPLNLEKTTKHKHNHDSNISKNKSGYKKFIKWIGNFHPIAIHFPIALIVMTGFSELLILLFPKSNFGYASRFMIVSAAITSVPAALLGLAYGYEAVYSGSLSDYATFS